MCLLVVMILVEMLTIIKLTTQEQNLTTQEQKLTTQEQKLTTQEQKP
jgi:energy-converting hydrogenase Eha subunit H